MNVLPATCALDMYAMGLVSWMNIKQNKQWKPSFDKDKRLIE
jgi:hypothetical protein